MSLDDLLRFGKLERHNTSTEEVKSLFGVVERCIKDASQKAISLDLRYVAAYQAALAAADALLNCLGYKTAKTGRHYMVWEALRQALDASFKDTLALFNDARSKRGDAFYDHADVVSETEFKELFAEADKFAKLIRAKIKKEFPELGKGL